MTLQSNVQQHLNDLFDCVGPSFGPYGLDAVVYNELQQAIVTNSGHQIIDNIPAHSSPASYVADSVKKATARVGDGCSTLILKLRAGMNKICESVTAADANWSQKLLPVIHVLGILKGSYLQTIILQVTSLLCIHVNIEQKEAICQAVQAVTYTSFAGKLGSAAVCHLANLLAELVVQRLQHRHSLSAFEVLHSLTLGLPVMRVAGGPVAMSRLLPGLLVSQGFCSNAMPAGLTQVRFVVLNAPLDGDASNGGQAVVRATSEEQMRGLMQQREEALRQKVELLRGRGVNLLLCTERVSDMAVSACVEAGINLVAALPQEEARSIAQQAGILPSTASGVSALADAQLGSAVSCKQLALSGRTRCLLLEGASQHCPSSMLLYAPSDGLCLQYHRMLERATKLLLQLAAQLPSLPQPPPVPNQPPQHHHEHMPSNEETSVTGTSQPLLHNGDVPWPSAVQPASPPRRSQQHEEAQSFSPSPPSLSPDQDAQPPQHAVEPEPHPGSSPDGLLEQPPQVGDSPSQAPSQGPSTAARPAADFACSTGTQASSAAQQAGGTVDQGQHLLVLPGAGACDAAIWVRIDSDMQRLRRGEEAACPHLREVQRCWPRTAVLCALQVLSAMAMAVPHALAATAVTAVRGSNGREGAQSAGLYIKQLMEALKAVHVAAAEQGLGCYMGLVVPGACSKRRRRLLAKLAPHVCSSSGLRGDIKDTTGSDSDGILVADAVQHGVIEPAGLQLELWAAALDILTQVLRVDAVLAARKERDPHALLAAALAPGGSSDDEDDEPRNDDEPN